MTSASSQFKAFGDKLIIFLLVAGIISNSLGVIAITNNSNEQARLSRQSLVSQATETRNAVEHHNNATDTTLSVLRNDIAVRTARESQLTQPFLDEFHNISNVTADTNRLLKQELDGQPPITDQLDRIEASLGQIAQQNNNNNNNSTSVVGNR